MRWVEIAVVIAIGSLASMLSSVVIVLTLGIADGTGFNQYTWEGIWFLSPWAAAGVIPAGLLWYAVRRDKTFRLLEGPLFGLFGFACGAAVYILPTLPPSDQMRFISPSTVLWFGFLYCLPAILLVAPLTAYIWHRTIHALRDSQRVRIE
jgi:hypothetical protein